MSPGGGDESPLGAPVTQAPAIATDARVLQRRTLTPMVQTRKLLVALLAVAVLYTCYFAASLILPMLIAALAGVLLNPLVLALNKVLRLPRWLGAALVVGGVLAMLVGFGSLIYEPALEAARDAPRTLRQLAPKLQQMARPIEEANRVSQALTDIQTTRPNAPQRVELVEARPTLPEVVANIGRPLAGALTAIVLVYFFLVYGASLLRRAVSLAPTLSDKRTTVEIVRGIQSDMSRYMLTITIINTCLGLATAGLMWLLGMPTPLLWGAVAGLLNFAPYVGPLVAAIIIGVVGLFHFDTLGAALLPAVSYLGLNVLEGQLLTPLLLGSSLALNPVIILLWLMFWGWLWGVPGFLLGVPMLVCFKIVCARIEALQTWSRLLDK